jgi:hypothetical protein
LQKRHKVLLNRHLHACANYLCGVEYAMQLQAYPLRGNFMEFFGWFVGECPPKGQILEACCDVYTGCFGGRAGLPVSIPSALMSSSISGQCTP